MSRFLKVGLALLASTALYAAPSSAADLDLPAPVIEHTPVVKGSGGFYLRGDIGYSIWQDPDLSFRNDTAGFSSALDNESADNAFLAGVGVGYKFRKYLRLDLTADIRTNKGINADTECGACAPIAAIAGRRLGQETNLDLSTFFANAYVDAGTFRRFTPYIGGGVGFAYLNYGRYISSNNPTTNNTGLPATTIQGVPGAPGPNPSNVENQLFRGDDSLRFAWNLQAGLSYDINDNLALDGSYRYTRIEGGAITDIGVGPVESDDLAGHEFRLGVRYTFGGGSEPSYEAPQPIFK